MSLHVARRGPIAVRTAIATQLIRPTSDILATNWTVTPSGTNFAAVDDTGVDDTDYTGTGTGGALLKLGLANATAVPSTVSHVINVRARGSATPCTITVEMRLSDGTTVVLPATSIGTMTVSFTDFQVTLSQAQAAAITNYNGLQLWFNPTPQTLNNVYISKAFLQIG